MSSEAPATDVGPSAPDDGALVPRLRVIEEQSLESRAAAYAQVHDELTARLDGGDATGANA